MTKRTKKINLKWIITCILVIFFIIGSIWFYHKKEQLSVLQYAQQKNDIQYIGQLLEKYYEVIGIYPCNISNKTTSCNWEEELLKVSDKNSIPRDPLSRMEYTYLNNGINSAVGVKTKSYLFDSCFKYPDYVDFWLFYRTVDKKITGGCADQLEELYISLWNPTNK